MKPEVRVNFDGEEFVLSKSAEGVMVPTAVFDGRRIIMPAPFVFYGEDGALIITEISTPNGVEVVQFKTEVLMLAKASLEEPWFYNHSGGEDLPGRVYRNLLTLLVSKSSVDKRDGGIMPFFLKEDSPRILSWGGGDNWKLLKE